MQKLYVLMCKCIFYFSLIYVDSIPVDGAAMPARPLSCVRVWGDRLTLHIHKVRCTYDYSNTSGAAQSSLHTPLSKLPYCPLLSPSTW